MAAEAISMFRKALWSNSNSPSVHFNLAVVLEGEGRIDEAIRHYREAVRLEPQNPKFLEHLNQAMTGHQRPRAPHEPPPGTGRK